MSDPRADVERSVGRTAPAPSRSWRRRIMRGLVLYAFTPYLAVAGLMTLFQRSLIYHGAPSGALAVEAAGHAGTVHPVRVTTHDRLELNGWAFLAEGRTAATAEDCLREVRSGGLLVLYFPGNAGNRRDRVGDCRDFAHLGAHVMLVDYRGYADNPGSPCEADLVADAMSVWRYAVEDCGAAPDKIVLYGESLGGGVAVRLASELCTRGTPPAGLVVSSTFSSLVDAGESHYPFLPVRFLLWDRFPSAEFAPAVTCPVLQIHGGRDTIVPVEIGRRLSIAFPEASAGGIPKAFVELPRAGHNDIPQADFRAAVAPFLESIGGALPASAP